MYVCICMYYLLVLATLTLVVVHKLSMSVNRLCVCMARSAKDASLLSAGEALSRMEHTF